MATYTESCDHFAKLAQQKAIAAKRAPLAFASGTMLAGAYIGVALVLALSCAVGLPAGVRPLVTGSVFGLGLLLVLFAGADMYTGYVMYVTFGLARKTITVGDAVRLFVYVWIGNLIGALIFSAIFSETGGGAIWTAPITYFHDYVMKKETTAALPLFCKATLCNWLVCLAIWIPARLTNEAAKIWAMAWCLLAFVALGFEHSVANMTAVALGLMAPGQVGSVAGAAYNLVIVTLGNGFGGALFVAGAYLLAAKSDAAPPAVSERKTEPAGELRSGVRV